MRQCRPSAARLDAGGGAPAGSARPGLHAGFARAMVRLPAARAAHNEACHDECGRAGHTALRVAFDEPWLVAVARRRLGGEAPRQVPGASLAAVGGKLLLHHGGAEDTAGPGAPRRGAAAAASRARLPHCCPGRRQARGWSMKMRTCGAQGRRRRRRARAVPTAARQRAVAAARWRARGGAAARPRGRRGRAQQDARVRARARAPRMWRTRPGSPACRRRSRACALPCLAVVIGLGSVDRS